MELVLRRRKPGPDAMLGDLYLGPQDVTPFCVTLEDIPRVGPKVQDKTAIPAGRYEVLVNMSPRFGKMMMRLLDVHGFTGILIHSLNTAQDTRGCIGVGAKVLGPNYIQGGSVKCPELQAKVVAALKTEKVYITIEDSHEWVSYVSSLDA